MSEEPTHKPYGCCPFHASGGHPRDRHGLDPADKVYGPKPWAHEQAGFDNGIDDPRELTEQEARAFGMPTQQLYSALRRVHDGSDRGELMNLLCAAWGPSPARAEHAATCGCGDCSQARTFEAERAAGRELGKGFVAGLNEPPDLRGLAARESATGSEIDATEYWAKQGVRYEGNGRAPSEQPHDRWNCPGCQEHD